MTEQTHTWTDVALTAIAALPGVIAAASSLRNGRTLKQNGKAAAVHRASKRSKNGTSKGDWYEPPDLSHRK